MTLFSALLQVPVYIFADRLLGIYKALQVVRVIHVFFHIIGGLTIGGKDWGACFKVNGSSIRAAGGLIKRFLIYLSGKRRDDFPH